MNRLHALQTILLRWVPGWRFFSAHAVAAKRHRDERLAARRLMRLGAKPRDGPH